MVDDALQKGVEPSSIAFLAFTRKAAEEAKERAAKRFNLDPKKDLFYFRTLHSLALSCSDIRPEQVMQDENYRELSNKIGVGLNVQRINSFDEDLPEATKTTDPVLGLINLARMRKVPLRQQYNETPIETEWNTVTYVDKCLTNYKENMEMYDFTDMLESFPKEGYITCPQFKLCFVDEAQDLSPIQWDIAHLLDEKSDRMYCAGDDDQAIYRWAGADVDHFIDLDGGSETLSQSYRVPFLIHQLAERVVSRIGTRFLKDYSPKVDEYGSIRRIFSVEEVDMSEGSWLILAQAGYQLQPVASELKSSGYLFNNRGHRSISERISDAVNGWEQLRKGKEVSGAVARKIYSYMSTKERVKRGFKTLSTLEDTDMVNMQALTVNFGLLATPDMVWHIAMDRIPESDRAYIIAMLRRGERFNGDPRITVSTIHGAKGGEADNVVLFTDLSPAAEEQMNINPDDTHRVFYVGVTRAKQNLFIVEPQDFTRSYDL
jgi:DNA helicase-2/ATP-dependent DNA helicase PcrA